MLFLQPWKEDRIENSQESIKLEVSRNLLDSSDDSVLCSVLYRVFHKKGIDKNFYSELLKASIHSF